MKKLVEPNFSVLLHYDFSQFLYYMNCLHSESPKSFLASWHTKWILKCVLSFTRMCSLYLLIVIAIGIHEFSMNLVWFTDFLRINCQNEMVHITLCKCIYLWWANMVVIRYMQLFFIPLYVTNFPCCKRTCVSFSRHRSKHKNCLVYLLYPHYF